MTELSLHVNPWLSYVAVALAIAASSVALWRKRSIYGSAWLIGGLCVAAAMIVNHIAYAPMVGMTAPPDGGPLVFQADRALITTYTVLQTTAWSALIIGFCRFMWVSVRQGSHDQGVRPTR